MIRKVAVIMGSDSDWPVVKGACAQLKALDIPFEAHILSAHRTPAEAADFAKNARANGFGVILCAAGMAAHLAGAFAANTTLPVIGIPMKGGAMDGLDALLASLYGMGYRPWQAELPGLDMNFTEMPVADQKRQMEILHMALGMLMNAPRGDACIMMAPGDMLPDLISDTPRKDVQLFTITVRRPTATLIVDMTAYSASF